MKIAVIGANGKTGQVFVTAALEAGHEIVAGIHRNNDLSDQPKLEIMSCDTTKADETMRLIAGCDAVVSLIGHGRRSPAHLQTETMRSLATAMKQTGITRLISLTGDGVREPGDRIGLIDRAMNLSIKLIDPKRIQDGIDHVRFLQQGELDYTVIRVLKLTNGPLVPFRLTDHGPARILAPRRAVANAILDCLEHQAFIRATPILARP